MRQHLRQFVTGKDNLLRRRAFGSIKRLAQICGAHCVRPGQPSRDVAALDDVELPVEISPLDVLRVIEKTFELLADGDERT